MASSIKYYPDSPQGPSLRSVINRMVDDLCRQCPQCEEEIYRSVRLNVTKESIKLMCTACDEVFDIPNSPEQENALRYKHGKFLKKEKLTSFDQLGIGDVYGLELMAARWPYTHTALCYDINRVTKQVLTVELFNILGSNRVIQETRDMSDEKLQNKNFVVYRYMPMDCLPLTETRTLAKRKKESRDWPESYSTSYNNCQHFTSWCKTGDKTSEDAEIYGRKLLFKITAGCKLCVIRDNSGGWNPGDDPNWKSMNLP